MLYPPVFNGLVFAVSAILAASFIRALAIESISLQAVQVLVAAWVLFAVVGSIWSLRTVPIELATVVSVALAAGIPMLAVLATRMPVEELLTTLLGALL